jgi:antirestriction protein
MPLIPCYITFVPEATTMAITLTTNYKEILDIKTVEKIDELLEDSYCLEDILEFIDEHNENDFVTYYEEYCRCGEAIGYDAVDAYIKEQGNVCYVENCDDLYHGHYDSEADFAEEFYNDVYGDVPSILVVDWEATWNSSFRYDFTYCNGYVFSDN